MDFSLSFKTGKYGKLNKCVTFPDMLDMIPFVTGTADSPPLYLLYAVVVHLDTFNTSFSGHYISYVKDLEGTWFRIDDSEVQAVPLSQVMSEGAYMLFYSRSFPRPPQAYVEKMLSRHLKSQKALKNGQQRRNEGLYGLENSVHLRKNLGLENEDFADESTKYIPRPTSRNELPNGTYPDTLRMEFSDATSSDWTLFTSSDDSSFTTESTRDSFSTVDYRDNTSLDATFSSIFCPFYAPEYTHSNTISCAKLTPCRPPMRFISASIGCVVDPSLPTRLLGGVRKGMNVERAHAASMVHSASASHCRLYDQWE